MFCPQCGVPNEDDAIFCGNCGAVLDPDALTAEPLEESLDESPEEAPDQFLDKQASALVPLPDERPPEPPPAPRPRPGRSPVVATSGLAIASLVLGIAGWTVLPILGSILAIVLGYAARNEIRRRPGQLAGQGLATAGLVLGWLMVAITVLALCLGLIGSCFLFGFLGSTG